MSTSYDLIRGDSPPSSERSAYVARIVPRLREQLASLESEAEDLRKIVCACDAGTDSYYTTSKGRGAKVQLDEIEKRIANVQRRISTLTTEN